MVEPAAAVGDPGDATPALVELASIVLGTEPLGVVLGKVAALACDAVPGAAEASVTVVEEGRARSIAFTGSLAARLDERQYEQGWGPCLDAAVTGETVVVDVATPRSAYTDFAAAAARAGVTAVVSIGLPVAGETVGGVNLYSTTGVFADEALELATAFAGYAAVAVANAARYASAAERADNMMAAMQSRAVIEQAKGIIMAAERCGPDEAFDTLVKASQQRNTKLRDVAAAIVRSTTPGADRTGDRADHDRLSAS